MKAPGFLRALTEVFLSKHEPIAPQTEGPALLTPTEHWLESGGTNPLPHGGTKATPLTLPPLGSASGDR